MKREEMKNVFNYVRGLFARYGCYDVETIDNGTDYIIDFSNGTSFSVDDVEALYDDFCNLCKAIDDYIDDYDLDSVNDYKKIVEHFKKDEDFFQGEQAYLTEFEDYALKHAIEVGKAQTYYIDYCTGVERDLYVCDLDEAKSIADKFACYTQCNIVIIDGLTKVEVTCRSWCGCLYGIEDEESPLQFGDFGYYGDWHEID